MAGSLYERLTLGEAGMAMDEDESIRSNILRMFIARQGSVQALPDYGLPDLNDLTLSRADLIKETCIGIEGCIRRYEPRLINVEVTHQALPESTFAVGLHITALKYDTQGRLQPWHWDLVLDRDQLRGRK